MTIAEAMRVSETEGKGECTRGLVGLRGMPAESMRTILTRARDLLAEPQNVALDVARGRAVGLAFLEPSTRTRGSFSLAAQRLGAMVVDVSTNSSASKGESIAETVRTLEAMGIDAIVVRSAYSGAAVSAQRASEAPIINAGDGRHEHPTQGLLDTLSLAEALGRDAAFDLAGVRVLIVGDIVASRVARSAVAALTTLGAHVTLVGPDRLAPDDLTTLAQGLAITRDFDAAIATNPDAVMMLRVQFERHADPGVVQAGYRDAFGLTTERARRLHQGAIVMHPGPTNPGVEIDQAVALGRVKSVRVLVRRQVRCGVAVRMAVLERALGIS